MIDLAFKIAFLGEGTASSMKRNEHPAKRITHHV